MIYVTRENWSIDIFLRQMVPRSFLHKAYFKQMQPGQGGMYRGSEERRKGRKRRAEFSSTRAAARFHRYLYRRINLRSFRLIRSLAGRLAINSMRQISGCRGRSGPRSLNNKSEIRSSSVRSTQIISFLDRRWQLWQRVWVGTNGWGSLGRPRILDNDPTARNQDNRCGCNVMDWRARFTILLAFVFPTMKSDQLISMTVF